MKPEKTIVEWLQTRLAGLHEADKIILDLVMEFGGHNSYVPTLRTMKQKALETEAKLAFERGESIASVIHRLGVTPSTAWRYFRDSRKAA